MKKYKLYITAALVASAMTFTSCSDDYMTSLNTDPSKAATIDPNAQLTTGELQVYGDIAMMETVRSYLYAFNQQLMGCWNTTNYGGRHTVDNNEMTHVWRLLYPTAIKNVTDAESRTHNDASKTNINAALRVYRTYLMSVISDIYGDAPYKEAGMGYINGIATPKFDKQEDIYSDFFAQLDTALTQFDASKDKITGDVIYKGDIAKWKKFANSLRMRYAMRISDVAPELAKTEFLKAANDPNGVMESSSDDALIKYINVSFSFGSEAYVDYRANRISQLLFGNDPSNNPSYICSTFYNQMKNTNDPRTYRIARFYYDGLMSATGPDNRVDLTDEILNGGVKVEPRDPGAYSWEPWPAGYKSTRLTEMAKSNSKIDPNLAREVEPKLATNFLKAENPGVVMTSAEVDFLMAEAGVKGWLQSSISAEDYYKSGVRKAMQFLSDNYGCDPISSSEIDTYLANNDFGHTAEKQKEAINVQAWILHFTNPFECWANVRRSGYPRMKSPADYGFGQFLTGGTEIPVRLCYPVLESSYNKVNYQEALDRMGGTDDWHTHVWWDVK